MDRPFNETIDRIAGFTGVSLTRTLARIESAASGVTRDDCPSFLAQHGADAPTLAAAADIKRLAGQINVTIHALGILRCLPHILEPGECVEYVSLGAGNTGRLFDLETNRRVAEFKFIQWRGGPESIRQNAAFKDFVLLAEHPTPKRKHLYLLGTGHALKFFRGGRALTSVLSRNDKLQQTFFTRFGEEFRTVGDYFAAHSDAVQINDVGPWLGELAEVLDV
jgi:hypothetical protein